MDMLQHPSQDLAKHVLPASRALRFLDGVEVAFRSGLVQHASMEIIQQAYIPCRAIRPQKACFGFYSRAEVVVQNFIIVTIFRNENIHDVAAPGSSVLVEQDARWYLILASGEYSVTRARMLTRAGSIRARTTGGDRRIPAQAMGRARLCKAWTPCGAWPGC